MGIFPPFLNFVPAVTSNCRIKWKEESYVGKQDVDHLMRNY
jgi:hypothetical protein